MSWLKDEIGNRYGMLVVIGRVPNKTTKARWLCQCDCGNKTEADGDALRISHKTSCGCNHFRSGSENGNFKGGHYKDRLYHVWTSMKQRCGNPKKAKYKYYGGRGISVCSEWNEYEVFRSWAYANGYDENGKYGETTLDRINPDGNYCPENCRFVNLSVQNKNRHKFNYLQAEGENNGE